MDKWRNCLTCKYQPDWFILSATQKEAIKERSGMDAIGLVRDGCEAPVPQGVPQYFKRGRLNRIMQNGEEIVVVSNENTERLWDENYVLNCPAYAEAAIAKAKGEG